MLFVEVTQMYTGVYAMEIFHYQYSTINNSAKK